MESKKGSFPLPQVTRLVMAGFEPDSVIQNLLVLLLLVLRSRLFSSKVRYGKESWESGLKVLN